MKRAAMRLLPKDREFGWTPYFWLIYLAIFLADPLLRPRALLPRLLTFASALAFIALYLRAWWLKGRQLLWSVSVMVVLGIVFIPWNAGASVFFIYAAGFVGALGPPRIATRYLAGVVAIVGLETVLVGLPGYAWIPALLGSLAVGGPNIYFMEMRRTRSRLNLAQEEIAHMAKIAERERIARDLHDLLGHTLSLIALKAELARKLADHDPSRAAQEIHEVEKVARETLSEVRKAVRGYRSRDLAGELAAARSALDAASIAVDAEIAALRLPASAEGVLAFALREALTNVVRHSQSRRCRVRLWQEDGSVRLEVEDDGRGGEAAEGTGLSGMRERASALGGTVERDGSRGMRIRVTLPIPQDDEAVPYGSLSAGETR